MRWFRTNTKEEVPPVVPITQVEPICGFKDAKGYFYETEEEAVQSNIRNEICTIFEKERTIYNERYGWYGFQPFDIAPVLLKNKDKFIEILNAIK